jgi:hypothetical protein
VPLGLAQHGGHRRSPQPSDRVSGGDDAVAATLRFDVPDAKRGGSEVVLVRVRPGRHNFRRFLVSAACASLAAQNDWGGGSRPNSASHSILLRRAAGNRW